MLKKIHEDYLRSLMFGLQDGLVSTAGVVVGISTRVSEKEIIVLAAFVAVTVEATSMAAGQYSSEKAVHQLDKVGKHTDSLIVGALIMFLVIWQEELFQFFLLFSLINPKRVILL